MSRHWVTYLGVANGNWSDINHWSDTSGGAGGFSVPSTTDDVFFDNLSNNASYTVSIDVNATARNLDIRNPSSGILTLKQTTLGSKLLTFYGSFYCDGTVDFSGINGSQTNGLVARGNSTRNITTNGANLPSITHYEGAILSLQDNLKMRLANSADGTVLCFFGGIITNGYDLDIGSIQTSGSSLVTLDIQNSTITCSREWINQGTNVSLSATGSVINHRGRHYAGTQGGVKGTYDEVDITWESFITADPIWDGGTANILRITGYHQGTYNKGFRFTVATTINNELSLNGYASNNRLLVAGNTTTNNGVPIDLTCNGTINASNVDFTDINALGTANWDLSGITGGSGDALGNSGITFTTPQKQYYKTASSSSQNWSTSGNWHPNSDGTGTGRVPLPQDDVAFIASSFPSDNRVIRLDRNRLGANIDFSATNYTVTLYQDVETYYYGNIVGSSKVTYTQTNIHYWAGRSTQTVQSNGMIFNSTTNIYAPGGSYTLLDNYKMVNGSFFGVRQGEFSSDGYEMDAPAYSLSNRVGSTSITLFSDVSNSLLITRGQATACWYAPTAGQSTVDFTNCTIKVINAIATLFAAGANYVYNNLTLAGSNTLSMTATTAVTFNIIRFEPTANMVFTIMNAVPVKYNEMTGGGQPRALMTLQNTSGTIAARLDKQTAGIVILNYMVFRYINSLDTDTIYAVNSYNIIGNVNIIFGQPSGTYRKSDFFMLM